MKPSLTTSSRWETRRWRQAAEDVRTIWEQAPQFKASQLDIALYLAATRTDHDLEAALRLMQSFSPDFIMGWLKKLTDSDAQQKIHDELVYQTANSEDMATSAP